MQINSKNDVHYGYVRVEMTAMDTKAVLSKTSHRIADFIVNISETNVPDDCLSAALCPLSVPPDQDATNHILVLNDDCLRNVLQRLNLTDLCKAADVCVRFNQAAKYIFRTNYSADLTTNYSADFNTFNFANYATNILNLKLSDIETLLRNFGPAIESLEIDKNLLGIGTFDRATDVICMISKYCRNVKNMTISNVNLNQEFKRLQPIFAQLEHFRMNEEEYDCFEKLQEMDATMAYLLSVCDNLKTLHLERNECEIQNPLKCIVQKFPSLQEARIDFYSSVHDDILKKFFELNPTLKRLEMYLTDEEVRPTRLFRWIGQHLVHLTELDIYGKFDNDLENSVIEQRQNDYQCLGRLSKLKVLKLNLCSLSVTPLIESLAANSIPIEHLEIVDGFFDNESIKNISKLKKIKILRLSYSNNMTDDYLIELAKELPQLSELILEFFNCYEDTYISTIGITQVILHANRLSLLDLGLMCIKIKIDIDDYNAILKSVQNRPTKTKLVIEFRSSAVKFDISETILHQNRDWINIISRR